MFSANGGFLIRNINFGYIRIETNNLVRPVWPLAVSSCLISSLINMVLLVLKVSKSQNIFFLRYVARAEFCLIFHSFLGGSRFLVNGVSRKIAFAIYF